jgi:hypothetical protein
VNVFRKLWQSIENLAAGLNALADTAQAVNDEIRQRVGIRPVEPRNILPLRDGENKDQPSGKRGRKAGN